MNYTNESMKKTHVWDIPDDGQAYPWTYRGVIYAVDHHRGIWTIRDDDELEWVGIYDPETDSIRKTKEPYFQSDTCIKDPLLREQQSRETAEELARVTHELIRVQNEVARLSSEMELRIRQEVELRIRQEMEKVVDPLQPGSV